MLLLLSPSSVKLFLSPPLQLLLVTMIMMMIITIIIIIILMTMILPIVIITYENKLPLNILIYKQPTSASKHEINATKKAKEMTFFLP